ncbi:hypothetical protein P7K49_040162 [Saguinus oedipus]|uniref:Uncharacterized protein n=1 Tax=Saguinus oedipus TaxID=9490 RepID=A0ABQ9T8H6_SAGOE|nr:hypothetical protein P7K49_040162 [Saguinus oedipus]
MPSSPSAQQQRHRMASQPIARLRREASVLHAPSAVPSPAPVRNHSQRHQRPPPFPDFHPVPNHRTKEGALKESLPDSPPASQGHMPAVGSTGGLGATISWH